MNALYIKIHSQKCLIFVAGAGFKTSLNHQFFALHFELKTSNVPLNAGRRKKKWYVQGRGGGGLELENT